jgi:hypothetical protein
MAIITRSKHTEAIDQFLKAVGFQGRTEDVMDVHATPSEVAVTWRDGGSALTTHRQRIPVDPRASKN